MSNFLKPTIKWVGGKTKLKKIIHDITFLLVDQLEVKTFNYYEPFFGGGGFFFHLYNLGVIKSAHINDTVTQLVSYYETIKDVGNIKKVYDQTVLFEEEFNELNNDEERKQVYKNWCNEFNSLWLNVENIGIQGKEEIKGQTEPKNNEERIRSASLFLALNKAGFNGMFRLNNNGKFNIPIGDKTYLNIIDKDLLRSTSKALKDVEINCGSYEEILPPNKKIDPKTSFIYLDPPYIPNSKTASFTDYSKEGFKEEDHIKLAEVFQELVNGGYKVVLSNNNNPEAVEKYVKGTKKTFAYEVMVSRQIASTATDKKGVSTRPKVSELLVSSFNLDELGLSRIDS